MLSSVFKNWYPSVKNNKSDAAIPIFFQIAIVFLSSFLSSFSSTRAQTFSIAGKSFASAFFEASLNCSNILS
ncbi:hypothetical protein D9M72_631790 [compost metagenome]